ncbi:putative 60S ribosomal protein L30 [Xylogone sp. PMI_703]|nr:putative 60S ribosomal protein L30 [Xylogone sp. PMI_703]
MAPRKEKKSHDSINARLALVLNFVGIQLLHEGASYGQGQLVIIAANAPPLRKSELEYYAMLSKSPVHHFNGNNIELGTACGKLYRCSTMVILDAGDSDILSQVDV